MRWLSSAWWTIGSASLLVAALLGWLLSRALLRRMRGLTRATHRLAAGDYATRIAPLPAFDPTGEKAAQYAPLAIGEHMWSMALQTYRYLREKVARGELQLPANARSTTSFGQFKALEPTTAERATTP